MTNRRMIEAVSILVILGSGIKCEDSSDKTTTLYLTEKDLDPETRRVLIDNYINEYFSEYQYDVSSLLPAVKFVMDSKSVLFENAHEDSDSTSLKNSLESEIEEAFRLRKDSSLKPIVQRLKLVLSNVFSVPRSHTTAQIYRDLVADYISRSFILQGLLTGVQSFQPVQFHDMFFKNTKGGVPTGTNIVGIYPGSNYGTPEDKILILGAHWDTVPNSDGYNDNGSGVVAVLEVAKLLSAAKCKLTHSIMFVTFDLEEVGSQGSLEFVQRLLLPHMIKYRQNSNSGAIIMDTMLNYNSSLNSQLLPYPDLLPRVKSYLDSKNYTGDYLTAYNRRSFDDVLLKKFERYWNRQKTSKVFHFVPSDLKFSQKVPKREEIVEFVNFLRSDHSRFWFPATDAYSTIKSFDAILLTDTGPDRGQMQECYHNPCDSVRNGFRARFANYDFYAHTIQAVLDTALDITQGTCPLRTPKSGFSATGKATQISVECHFFSLILTVKTIMALYI
ncbi:hypothetical protein TCAL_04393 [Tigriopus californicus]|uniref:Peptidase M28 domain-containing protein n=1 Tax=Tigriopus californicus TaxID=6832 RepID=A0A553N7R6_TIGCA|nr:hypothetical protein TCAL_04393 [Tigriopus californicus]